MAVSESKKKANMKWDSANMATLACKVKKEQAERFKAYCADAGETVNAVLQSYVAACITGAPCKGPQKTGEAQEHSGSILTPSTLRTAREAAQNAGETVPVFVERAVETQAKRDKLLQGMKKAPEQTDA